MMISGIQRMNIQNLSVSASLTYSGTDGSGRANPKTRHKVTPMITPKFVVNPNQYAFSAGTVSF